MMIELGMSTASWIPSLIDNTVLHFSSTTLIEKVIFLSENPFIFSTTAKMLLMSFMPQTLLLLNPMSILVQFLTVNVTTSVQILPKPCPDSVSTKTLTRFLLLQQETTPNKILLRSILFSSSLVSNLASFSPTSSTLIVPYHIKMCLVLW